MKKNYLTLILFLVLASCISDPTPPKISEIASIQVYYWATDFNDFLAKNKTTSLEIKPNHYSQIMDHLCREKQISPSEDINQKTAHYEIKIKKTNGQYFVVTIWNEKDFTYVENRDEKKKKYFSCIHPEIIPILEKIKNAN